MKDTIVKWVFLAIVLTAWSVAVYQPAQGCITDEECMAHCPPPADDPDCDGGPQP